MMWRSVVVGAALALTAIGCGDPLADKLEASGKQPYSDDDPPLVTSTYVTTTTAPVPGAPPGPTTAPPAPTTAPPAPAGPTREQFVAEANDICARGIAEAAGSLPSDPAEVPAFFEEMVAGSQAMLDGIRQLAPPPGDEATVAHLLAEHEAVLGAIRTALDEGRLSDEAGMRAVTAEIQPRSDALDRAYRDYGLTSCA